MSCTRQALFLILLDPLVLLSLLSWGNRVYNILICSVWVVLCGALQEHAKLPMFDQNLGKNLYRKKMHCEPCTQHTWVCRSDRSISSLPAEPVRIRLRSGRVAGFKVFIDLETMGNVQNFTGFSREPVAMSLQSVDELSEPDAKWLSKTKYILNTGFCQCFLPVVSSHSEHPALSWEMVDTSENEHDDGVKPLA